MWHGQKPYGYVRVRSYHKVSNGHVQYINICGKKMLFQLQCYIKSIKAMDQYQPPV